MTTTTVREISNDWVNYHTHYFDCSSWRDSYNRSFSHTVMCNEIRTHNSNPLWRKKILSGQDASTSYKRCGIESYQNFHIRGKSIVRGGCAYYFCTGYTNRLAALPSYADVNDYSLRDIALSRLKNKLRSHTGEWNAAIPLVELRELRKTIIATAKAAIIFLPEYHQKRKTWRVRKIRNSFVRELQDAWLTWSFGIKPLISDTQQAISSIQDFLGRSDHAVRLTGNSSKSWLSSTSTTGQTALNGNPLDVYSNHYHELSYRYIGGFDIETTSSNVYDVLDLYGFGVRSIPSLFWELTPYSWVIDYFSNVSAYLEDTFMSPPGDTKYLVLNRRYKRRTVQNPAYRNLNGIVITESVRNGFADYYQFERTVLSGLPRTGLHFHSVDPEKSWVNRLLNLASVLKLK